MNGSSVIGGGINGNIGNDNTGTGKYINNVSSISCRNSSNDNGSGCGRRVVMVVALALIFAEKVQGVS